MKLDTNVNAENRNDSKPGSHRTPCLIMLRGLYPVLTDAEKRVADKILEDPSLCLHSSIAVVAERCGVGVSTISRLSAKLGYESFPEMKLALAIDLLNPDRGAVEPVGETDDARTVVSKVLRAAARNLEDTAELLDPNAIEQSAKAILNARRIEIYAVGILMGAVARQAEGRLRLLQVPCAAVTEQWEHGVCAALLGPGDVAIGLSYSGDTEAIADALRVAGASGATTICITKAQRSLVAGSARFPLYVAAQEEGRWGDFVASRISMLGVIESLYALALLTHSRNQPGESDSEPTSNTSPA